MATLFSPDPAEFRSLQDKVVVLTGLHAPSIPCSTYTDLTVQVERQALALAM